MLTVLWENAPPNPEQRALLERLCAAARAAAHAPPSAEVTVLLTDDTRLHALNRAYRGKDAPTDVLAFPQPPQDASCKPALPERDAGRKPALPAEDAVCKPALPEIDAGCKTGLPAGDAGLDAASPDGGECLGDIAISLPRVRAQAAAYGHSPQRELAYLFVHGFLHLLGHTHNDDTAYTHMRAQEEAILKAAGLPRLSGTTQT